jgi:hypothetical protein
MAEIPALFVQRPIVLRHQKAALYHPMMEAVALTLVDIPITFIIILVFSVVVYFLTGLQRTAAQFLYVVSLKQGKNTDGLFVNLIGQHFLPVHLYLGHLDERLVPCCSGCFRKRGYGKLFRRFVLVVARALYVRSSHRLFSRRVSLLTSGLLGVIPSPSLA